MEIAYTVILMAGFVILAYYQNKRMQILQKKMASQNEVLERLQAYLDIFDPKKLQAWIQCKEKTIEQQNDAEIEKMCSWMVALMQERFGNGPWKEREIAAGIDLVVRLLFYAPKSVRETAIAKMPNSMYKDAVRKVLVKMPECDQLLPPAGSGLSLRETNCRSR